MGFGTKNDCAGEGQQQFSSQAVRATGVQLCEPLLWEVGSWGRGHFENQEEGKRRPLAAATKQRLVKTVTYWEYLVSHIVICEMCRTVKAYSLLVVTSCKNSVHPISDPNPVYSH
jgi:hypothetical protein